MSKAKKKRVSTRYIVATKKSTYVSRRTKLNRKQKKLYVEANVANMFGRSVFSELDCRLYFCKSWPSTTEMDENCMNNFRRWCGGCCGLWPSASALLSCCSFGCWPPWLPSRRPEQECSTKMPGKKRTKAMKPVEALTHLKS